MPSSEEVEGVRREANDSDEEAGAEMADAEGDVDGAVVAAGKSTVGLDNAAVDVIQGAQSTWRVRWTEERASVVDAQMWQL